MKKVIIEVSDEVYNEITEDGGRLFPEAGFTDFLRYYVMMKRGSNDWLKFDCGAVVSNKYFDEMQRKETSKVDEAYLRKSKKVVSEAIKHLQQLDN